MLQDVVDAGDYDLVIGDEAWDADHFWHDNPELKRTAFAWLTDFVGWLPMPAGGQREAFLTADYNAEMIEQVERYPRVRDRAIFVGNSDDIVPDTFGPGLPTIREWTGEHYDFAGYVTGFDRAAVADRSRIREQLGYRPGRVGVSGDGRRIGGGSTVAAPSDRRVPAGPGIGSGPADGGGHRPSHRPGIASGVSGPGDTGAMSTICTGSWPPVTSRWSRAG